MRNLVTSPCGARLMMNPGFGLLSRDTRSDWVRLRTLILLRWMAITGQIAAIPVADRL